MQPIILRTSVIIRMIRLRAFDEGQNKSVTKRHGSRSRRSKSETHRERFSSFGRSIDWPIGSLRRSTRSIRPTEGIFSCRSEITIARCLSKWLDRSINGDAGDWNEFRHHWVAWILGPRGVDDSTVSNFIRRRSVYANDSIISTLVNVVVIQRLYYTFTTFMIVHIIILARLSLDFYVFLSFCNF